MGSRGLYQLYYSSTINLITKQFNDMGQMINVFYLGAYLEVNDDDFQIVKSENEFYEEVGEEHFVNPYQGLEDLNILIPNSTDYCEQKDLTGEFVINNINLTSLEEKFKEGYAEQIAIVERYFPGKVSIKSGLVCYWDEIA